MKEMKCPYCDHYFSINHEDDYDEGTKYQCQCPKCEKYFVYETVISFDYFIEKADCLNGRKHEYVMSCTYPKEFEYEYCKICGKRK
jgi:hypothetical protein